MGLVFSPSIIKVSCLEIYFPKALIVLGLSVSGFSSDKEISWKFIVLCKR